MEQNRNYEKLSFFYDLLMQGIDYEAWVSYVEEIVERFQGRTGSVVDLACGTGSSALPWARRGYRTFGVDLSAEMLALARKKAAQDGCQVTFLQQDLRFLRLPEAVDLAVCFQDGFNYILELPDLRRAFQAVFRNLNNGGLFVFDLNYLPQILSESEESSAAWGEGYSFSWRTRYLKEERIWEIVVSGEVKRNGEHIECFSETHRERIHEPQEVWSLLCDSGFVVQGNYQAFTFNPPHEGTFRVVYIAQKVKI